MKQNIRKITSQSQNEPFPALFFPHSGIKKSNTLCLVLRYYYQFKKQTDPLASISSYKAGTDTLEINIGDTTLNNV